MNIVKLENVRRINSTSHSVEVKAEYNYSDKNTSLIVLSEDDINNDNCLLKLRAYSISVLLIPKKYKFNFMETPTGKLIQQNMNENCIISYF